MEEMQANEALTRRTVHDLNASPEIPFPENSFDAVLLSSVFPYLTEPESVLAEVSRVLSPAGVVIVSFSDRVWTSKATDAWKTRGNLGRCQLVRHVCPTSNNRNLISNFFNQSMEESREHSGGWMPIPDASLIIFARIDRMHTLTHTPDSSAIVARMRALVDTSSNSAAGQ